jgi:hypothetical protein
MDAEQVIIRTELVGIKNLKSTHNWRLEFDVSEIDSHKVADLVHKIDDAFNMILIEE